MDSKKNYSRVSNNPKQIVLNFLAKSDVPRWFRGISEFQKHAADQLLTAIRDDCAQSTTHRVIEILNTIGLRPRITTKDASILLQLCKGNDLAFLWFLMEMKYKTSGKSYSINEQLIMTLISHLDTIPTLRELDRILPKGKRLRKEKKRISLDFRYLKALESMRDYNLPYFKKQVRPLPMGSSMELAEPRLRVNFGAYEKYQIPGYILPNELNRWYEDYSLQPGGRIVKNIIQEEIGNIVDPISAGIVKGIIEEELDNIGTSESGTHKSLTPIPSVRNLCQHHKEIEKMEKSLRMNLELAARQSYLKSADYDGAQKEASQKRVAARLQKDIDRFVCQFQKLASKTPRQSVVKVIANECDCCTKLVDHMDAVSGDPTNCTLTNETTCRQKGGAETTSTTRQPGCRININPDAQKYIKFTEMDDISCTLKDNTIKCHPSDVQIQSQTFFFRPTDHTPYFFDYEKIFKFENDDDFCIGNTFAKALDSEVSLHVGKPPDVSGAAKKCANKIWEEQSAIKKKEMEIQEKRKRIVGGESIAENTVLIFPEKYYNPRDSKQMDKMMIEALRHMAKNRKFVLASMPDAYKMLILREWIKRRYGNVYTRSERVKSYNESKKVYRALDIIPLRANIKTGKQSEPPPIDYSCRDYLLKKGALLRQQYKKIVDEAIMERARILWLAMMPFQCLNGPPRNTFYAYLPPRPENIHCFRTWKFYEFMDAKNERDRRNEAKKADEQH